MNIALLVKISEDEFVEISKETYKKNKKNIAQWLSLIVIYFVSLNMLLMTIIDFVEGKFLENISINIYAVVIALTLIFGIPQLRIYNYRKFYRKNTPILEALEYNIDDEFINLKTGLSESKTSWKAILQVQELTDWFLLRPNTVSFHPLPKNQLNPSQQTWLREKITTK
jgi:YcxB-like protein